MCDNSPPRNEIFPLDLFSSLFREDESWGLPGCLAAICVGACSVLCALVCALLRLSSAFHPRALSILKLFVDVCSVV